ncbi:glycosyl hydrolase [Microbacterium paludicola]|uniref:glycosyl hydrolase n=1 Tax=Microbacterium paludicola TaxID=300019 RepID=UPI0031D1944F
MRTPRRPTAAAALLPLLALSACVGGQPVAADPEDGPATADWAAPDAIGHAPELPVQRISDVAPSRLADGLLPPTNRWFSGLVFGAEPQTVHPYPLAFRLTDSGFAFDLPDVVASADAILAPFDGGITVDAGATGAEVVRYDEVSVTIRLSDDDGAIGDLTLAEGWPVVAFTAARETALGLDKPLTAYGDDLWTTAADDVVYGLTAPGAGIDGGTVTIAAGSTAQWWPVPHGSAPEEWAAAIGDPVTGVETAYALTDDSALTRLTYAGTDRTIVVPFPGSAPADGCTSGAYETAFGAAAACRATTLSWGVPRIRPAAGFDLPDSADLEGIRAQLAEDLAATLPTAADTYFGGKGLARLASLLLLARSLGDRPLEDEAAALLERELGPWTDPDGCLLREERCLAYDDRLQLVVGRAPSFGSEEGNDHHFHYGYFLFAAAALAEARPRALERMTPAMDALAADIAGGARDALPSLRTFDPHRGHSWASGTAPFADGNNQESSSEAVAAWNGLALWAAVRGDDALRARAEWLLSAEAHAARTLWLEPDGLPAPYAHGIVSLTWGGKRDYATWFSPEPSAILGIQLLPVGPVGLQYLGQDPERVAANVAATGGEAAFDGELGEYVLLYSALAGDEERARAAALVHEWDPADLDDGLAASVAMAWLAAIGDD